VEEARKQFADVEGQLLRDLEDERKLQQREDERVAAVEEYMTGIEAMIKDTDAKAPSKFFFLLLKSFSAFAGLF
jgi:hypothetical protein